MNFWQYKIHLWQNCGLPQTGLKAPEDPGDAVHLVVGEPLHLGVHADRVRGRWLISLGDWGVTDLCNVQDWIEIESRLRFSRN